MSSHDKPALQSLLSPRSVDEFLSDYWPDKTMSFAVDGDPAWLPEFLHAKELSSCDALAHINKRPVIFGSGPKNAHMALAEAKHAIENGAASHYDPTDVFSIQLRGTKRFELARVNEVSAPCGKQYSPGASRLTEETFAQMVNGFPDWRGVEFETVEMKPGSVLFFPRGVWHRT